MLHGEVDVAGVSEYAVVLNALNGNNISVLASTVGMQNVYLIGLKDRGIGNITDLRERRSGSPGGRTRSSILAGSSPSMAWTFRM